MKLKDILNLFKTEEEIRAAMPLSEVVSVLKQKIIDAINKGQISEARLEESVKKILMAKYITQMKIRIF